MKVGEECPLSSIPSRLRLGIVLVIVLVVISSPVVMLVNPALAKSPTSTSPLPTISTTPSAPSTISQDGKDGDFTTQAALSLTRATQTSNIVNSRSYYDIMFRTTTAGIIKTVEIDFPEGTYVGVALLVEATGIGPGTIASDNIDDKITYTVTNAVNVPANTKIRIQLSNINNPQTPDTNYMVTITTRNAANTIIDGPTATTAYNIKQIGSTELADNAVTTPKIVDNSITLTKPAESFMKRVTVFDDIDGNAKGWNPNGATTTFTIFEPAVIGLDFTFISVQVLNPGLTNKVCDVVVQSVGGQTFTLNCAAAPSNNNELHYVVENLPPHLF